MRHIDPGPWRGIGLALLSLALTGCGSSITTPTLTPSPRSAQVSAVPTIPSPSPSTAPPSPSPSPVVPVTFPLAVVATETDLRAGYTGAQLTALLEGGTVLVPCGLDELELDGRTMPIPPATCTPVSEIPSALRARKDGLGLLPPGLVDPRVKVLPVDGADLFGNQTARAKAYPIVGRSAAPPPELAGPGLAYDPADIRTVVSTGDTCPDRAPSHWANVVGKGWDWTLQGGTARYTGIGVDRTFTGPTGDGWPVVRAVRTGEDVGAVWAMIQDADLAVNDFECPMIKGFTQHDHGTFFTIDPRVAGLMARVGMDVVSLGSNHISDLGADGIRQTLAYLDAAGVKHAGAGMDLAGAMRPAVVDVHGLKFAILSGDATGASRAATASGAGSFSPTTANVAAAVTEARSDGADVVILMPQWNFPEYSAPFSKTALKQRDAWFAAGVDHILGSGTHWAGAMSVTEPDPAHGWRAAVTSHGNFLFGQMWSRQTQEGVVYELTFRGTRLVQVRIHPYIVMDGAQPNLTDSTTDGAYVQRQVFGSSLLP